MSEFYPKAYHPAWERQADATLNQATPTPGTQYTVLAATANVRILSAVANATWTVQPNPLEIHITVDGVVHTHTFTNPVTATEYMAFRQTDVAATAQGLKAWSEAQDLTAPAFLYEGRSITVTAEVTGGTTDPLTARVKYEKQVEQ